MGGRQTSPVFRIGDIMVDPYETPVILQPLVRVGKMLSGEHAVVMESDI